MILLVGISNGMVGVRYLLLPQAGVPSGAAHLAVAGVTLAVMVAANVYSRGVLGLSCALFGMLVGYAAAIVTGVLPANALEQVARMAPVALPWCGRSAGRSTPR